MIAQSFLRKIGGLTIGITGVSNPKPFKDVTGVKTIDWSKALVAELDALKKAHHCVRADA